MVKFALKLTQLPLLTYSRIYEMPSIKSEGSMNYYVGMSKRKFSYRKKENIADTKFNRKAKALAKLQIRRIHPKKFQCK